MTERTTQINAERLWHRLMAMAEIGATPGGGSGRLALSDEDRAGRDLFVGWCREAGFAVRVDQIGNIFARRPGTDAEAPPVITGSHLDTQPLGGRFDGVYGVLAGLEVLMSLDDAGIETCAPLEVVNWTDEEGVRFDGGGCVASSVFAGTKDLSAALSLTDRTGAATMGSELSRIGYAGTAPVGGLPVSAYFEIHIEQGPVLETKGNTIGAVLGAQGRWCLDVTVTGEEGHAGTLPMAARRDAMVGAARMISALTDLASSGEPPPVITMGHLQVRPNSRNTIPGEVVFTVDCRHPDADVLARLRRQIDEVCTACAGQAGVAVRVREASYSAPVQFDPDCAGLIGARAAALGLPWQEIYSGASHDACQMAACAPTGMIFIPCERGISHNEAENCTPEDVAAGCQVLLETLVTWSNQSETGT